MSETPWRTNRHHIECCKDCKPPKRYPGCGDHCKEYQEEKAKLRRKMQAEKENRRATISQYDFDKVRMTASRKRHG